MLLDLIQHRNCYRFMYSNSPDLQRQDRFIACTSVYLFYFIILEQHEHAINMGSARDFFLQNRYKNERKKMLCFNSNSCFVYWLYRKIKQLILFIDI